MSDACDPESRPAGPPAARAGRGWHVAWAAVFAANLPAPLYLASELDGHAAYWAGVAAALLAALALGHRAVARDPAARGALVSGGVVVALTQVFPVVQVYAGIGAAVVAQFVVPEKNEFARGFWLTTFTGALLVAVALLCGALVRLVFSAWTAPEDGAAAPR
jgi:asparagine N-glycosylation enzyme membrane subunit Stt3